MARPVELLFEVTVTVDPSEVDTPEVLAAKVREVKKAIESLDPSIGIFEAEEQ